MAAANQTTQEYQLFNEKGELLKLVRANSESEARYIAGVSQNTVKEVPTSKTKVSTKHDSFISK